MFKVGDHVQVKGIFSPPMVVTGIKAEDIYVCLWFDKDSRMSIVDFPGMLIEKVGADPGRALQ